MNQEKIDVGCGVIFKDQKILIAQRPPNSHLGGYWEFPGGKKEKGENLFECLVREIEEELGVIVNPFETLRVVEHVALERTLRLHFVSCRFLSGVPQKRECMNFRWVKAKELHQFLFPPADRDLICDLIAKERYYFRRGNII
jgi:8-oxo-dGTP diphosphatase